MDPFTPNQWLVVLLAFLLGMFIGMALLAGTKWKRRWREEVRRREEVEAENVQLRKDMAESDTLHRAALRERGRPLDPDPEPPPVSEVDVAESSPHAASPATRTSAASRPALRRRMGDLATTFSSFVRAAEYTS